MFDERLPTPNLALEAAHKEAEASARQSGGYTLGPGRSPLIYGPEGAIAIGFGHCSHQQPALERLVRLATAAIAAGLDEAPDADR